MEEESCAPLPAAGPDSVLGFLRGIASALLIGGGGMAIAIIVLQDAAPKEQMLLGFGIAALALGLKM